MRKYYTNDSIITVIVVVFAIILAITILHINIQGKQYRDNLRKNSINSINSLITKYFKEYHYYPNEIFTLTDQSVPSIIDLYSNNGNLLSSYTLCKTVINPQLNMSSASNYPNCRNTTFNTPLMKKIQIKTNSNSTYYFYIPFKKDNTIDYGNNIVAKNYILGTCLENKSMYIKYSNRKLYDKLNNSTIKISNFITLSCL